jgi:hypothetical protein
VLSREARIDPTSRTRAGSAPVSRRSAYLVKPSIEKGSRLKHERHVAARKELHCRAAGLPGSIPTGLVPLPVTHTSNVSVRVRGFNRKLKDMKRVSDAPRAGISAHKRLHARTRP